MTFPEFRVELVEWPLEALNNMSRVRWTVRNVPMQWEDEFFEDLPYENIFSSVWASNCTALAWGCLQGFSGLLNVSTNNGQQTEEGIQYITIMACDTKDNCGFLHSSPLLVDRSIPIMQPVNPFARNYTQQCCFTDPVLFEPAWGLDELTNWRPVEDPQTPPALSRARVYQVIRPPAGAVAGVPARRTTMEG